MAHVFNSVNRAAVFAAVRDRVPQLLTFVRWAYGTPTDLHVAGAPSRVEPSQSQISVRQDDSLGILLLAIPVQASLEHADGAASGATIVAIADDIAVAGRVDTLRTAFHCLVGDEGVRAAGLRLRPRKCILAAGRAPECAAAGAALAAELGIWRRPEGAMFFGYTVRNGHARGERCERARDTERVDKLFSLPLGNHSDFSYCASHSRGAYSVCNASCCGRASRRPCAAWGNEPSRVPPHCCNSY